MRVRVLIGTKEMHGNICSETHLMVVRVERVYTYTNRP